MEKLMIKKALWAASCVLSLGVGSVYAEGLYVGLSAGVASVDIDKSSFDSALTDVGVTGLSSRADESDVGYKVYLGYGFTPYFALEAGYVNLGSAEYKARFDGGTAKVDWKSHGTFVQAVGRYQAANGFGVFAKGGAYFSENEAELSATGPGGSASADIDDDEVNLVLGLGAEYAFDQTTALRVEWERFVDVGDQNNTGESDVDLVTLGVTFNF